MPKVCLCEQLLSYLVKPANNFHVLLLEIDLKPDRKSV